MARGSSGWDSLGVCCVCHATSCGLGVNKDKWTVRFYCDTCGPKLAQKWVNMKGSVLNEVETAAIDRASAEAGQFLDAVGVTDLAALTEEQYKRFWRTGLSAYIRHLRELTQMYLPAEDTA